MGNASESLHAPAQRDAITVTEGPAPTRSSRIPRRRPPMTASPQRVSQRMSAWIRRFGLVAIVALAVGGLVGWSAATVFAPARSADVGKEPPTALVRQGTVGSSVPIAVSGEWTSDAVIRSGSTGTITSVADLGASPTRSGTTLYSVDLRPVVAVDGTVPAFRTMGVGAVGADVEQLQQYLFDADFLAGRPTGTFDSATAQAVMAWHRNNGLPAEPSVAVGEVIFVPSMPRRLVLDPKLVQVGTQLAGGEQTVMALSAAPTFTSHLSASAAGALRPGMPVSIRGPKNENWSAEAGKPSTIDGDTVVTLRKSDGGAPCADGCGELSTSGATVLSGVLVVSPARSGLTVPSAALRSAADGRVFLTDTDGNRHFVKVVVSADGLSLVRGAPKGLHVRLDTGS